jgi:hypothetical protein
MGRNRLGPALLGRAGNQIGESMKTGRYAVLSSFVLALLVAPFAIAANGDPITAGGRTTFTGITRVLGNSSTYATQQSNLNNGDGGAARYGCRSNPGREACLLSKNLGGGAAFRFQAANADLGGSIDVEPPTGKKASDVKPFTTNATGVATGLNADQVDGKSADEIVKQSQQDAASVAPYARVTAAGKTDANRSRGVADSNITKGTVGVYCFTGLAASPRNANVTLDGVAGETSVDTTTTTPGAACSGATNVQLIVQTYDSTGALTDKPFYVSITGA